MKSLLNIGQYKITKKSKPKVMSFDGYNQKIILEYKEGKTFKQLYIYTSCEIEDSKIAI